MFEDNQYMAKVRSNLGDVNLQAKIDNMLGKNQPQEEFEE